MYSFKFEEMKVQKEAFGFKLIKEAKFMDWQGMFIKYLSTLETLISR